MLDFPNIELTQKSYDEFSTSHPSSSIPSLKSLKESRIALGLPKRKELIYWSYARYPDITPKFTPQIITSYSLHHSIGHSPNISHIITVELKDGRCVNILSDYLVEMQDKNFCRNYEMMEEKMLEEIDEKKN